MVWVFLVGLSKHSHWNIYCFLSFSENVPEEMGHNLGALTFPEFLIQTF
jgi:hypothetical protein